MHITVKPFFTLIKFIYRPGNGYILQVVPNAVLLLRDCELVQTLDIGGIHDFMLVVLILILIGCLLGYGLFMVRSWLDFGLIVVGLW